MKEFDEKLGTYREKRDKLISTLKTKTEEKKNTRTLPPKEVQKESRKENYSNAYRQILASDFDNAKWISKAEPLRKHRKNINRNYKSLTGRKWGLSDAEKLKRKGEFEARRDISLKASMALEAFIENTGSVDPDPADESLLKTVEETDLSQFVYRTEGKKSVVESDADFVAGFADRMSRLHGATLLYNKLLTEKTGVSPGVMMKLSRMNDMRQAYEDRIRIISSPYYVSLREADFDKTTKKNLRKSEDGDKMDSKLKSYGKAMLRWQESGKKLLAEKRAAVAEVPAEKVVQEDNVLAENKAYLSDQAMDKVIDKVNGKTKNRFKQMVNGERDLCMSYTREWVYSDLKSKTKDNEMMHEADRMKNRLREELADNTTEESVRKNKEKVLRHLDRVTAAFAAKKISSDVMRIWLDRCLQHKLNYSREMYLSVVHQANTDEDEEDYYENVQSVINPYVKKMSGVVFAQSALKAGVYQRKEDAGETNDPAILHARRKSKTIKSFPGMGKMSQNYDMDFIHISGKNADYNDISTRAYVSAKPKYKTLAVKLFTETVAEFEHKNMRDELYFKIANNKDQARGFSTDDLTIFLGSNITMEERKQLLDRFYEKCEKAGEKGENILDGEDMVIAGSKYKEGIALAGEPDIASLLNANFSNADKKFKAKYSIRTKLEKMQRMSRDEIRSTFSFNTFVVAMLIQSTFIVGHRMGTDLDTKINTDDPKVREETRRVFRQLCFLNGINPENMADIDNTSILV